MLLCGRLVCRCTRLGIVLLQIASFRLDGEPGRIDDGKNVSGRLM